MKKQIRLTFAAAVLAGGRVLCKRDRKSVQCLAA